MGNKEGMQGLDWDGKEINFSHLFDMNEIQRLQDIFADACGVASIITRPDGIPITAPSNFCRLCKDIIRKTETGRKNCLYSDAEIGRENPSGPSIQRCLSGGLWDAGSSITVGGNHIANWLIGQVRNEEVNEQQMLTYADEIGVSRDIYMEALREVPVMSVKQFSNVAKMLFAFATQLSEKAYTNLQLKMMIAEGEKVTRLLQSSAENYSEIFQTVSEGICHTTLNGEIISVNKSFEIIAEIPNEELVGRNIMELAREHIPSETLSKLLPVLQNPIQEQKSQLFELEYKNKILEIHAIINNNTRRLTGVVHDITARKLAEVELEESREKYRGLSEAAFESIFLSEKGICIEQNKTAEKMFGYTTEEAIGRYPSMLTSGHHDGDFYRSMWEIIHATGTWQGEIWDRRKNGEIYPKWLTISAVKGDNDIVTHYVGAHSDIT